MAMLTKDLIILGAGPGGYVAAIRAAQLGRQVTIIEREALGGVCLNWGCIPSKALLKAAHLYSEMKRSAEFGFEIPEPAINFPQIIDRSREVVRKLSNGVNFLMRKNKIEVLYGTGSLECDHCVQVTDQEGNTSAYKFKDLIIATGARPKLLPGVIPDGDVIHTSRTILEHRRLPRKLLVIGAGAIGIEFAYFFSTLGVQVTVAEMLPQILPLEDTEIAENLNRIFTRRGMNIKTNCKVESLTCADKSAGATLKSEAGQESWQGDCVLIAIGVTGNVAGIGLEKVGVKVEGGFIAVDEYMRTNMPHYYAIGDAAGPPWLAHVASHEGIVAAEHCSGKSPRPMNYDNIPTCTYCLPQAASVGLSEKAAQEQGLTYKVGKMPFSANGKAIATGDTEGFIKVLIDSNTSEILGVHILQAEATELISEAAVIRSREGIAQSVLDTIHPHPTLSEAFMEAIGAAIGRPINT